MKIQLIRHATLRLQYAGVDFLIDPMLSDAGVNPPVINTANNKRNPLVALPSSYEAGFLPQAVLVSHLHQDHWDEAAAAELSKSTPILCQPGDETVFHKAGFSEVLAIEESLVYKGVTIYRTSGQHGTGEIGRKMGNVSGFVLKADCEPTLYIAGDTIWCEDVCEALDAYRPEVTVVNAGGARFVTGDPITMDEDDITSVCRYASNTKVVAVHMDAINHCLVTRADLREYLAANGLMERVTIPEDGEWIME